MRPKQKTVFRWLLAVVLAACIVLPVVWAQFLAPRSKIPFEELRNKLLLEFSYSDEVDRIAALMTQRTRYRNRVLINLRPRAGYLTILLLDTKEVDGLSRDTAAFIKGVRYQCVALPKEETVVCDSRLLDSIDFFGLKLKDDTEMQPSLTRSWLIGHEIGHVVLRHGSGSFGFFSPLQAAQELGRFAPGKEQASPASKVCEQIADDDRQKLRALFYMEHAADRFALERLKPNKTMSVLDHHHGNWYMELLAEYRKKQSKQAGVAPSNLEGETLAVHLPLDLSRHPPMLWRLHWFLTRAQQTYKDFVAPTLNFEPDLSFCFEEKRSEDEDQKYYQDGFYVRGPEDSPGTRQLLQLVDDLLAHHAKQHDAEHSAVFQSFQKLIDGVDEKSVVDPKFCSSAATKPGAENIAPMLKDACFAVLLGYFVDNGVCPPDAFLKTLHSEEGGLLYSKDGSRPREHFAAFALLTALIGQSCQNKAPKWAVAANFRALEILTRMEADGLANLLVPDFASLLANLQTGASTETASPGESRKALFVERYNALFELRELARRELWFSDAAALSGQLSALVEENAEYAPAGLALDLRRQKSLIELENALIQRPRGIQHLKELYADIIKDIDSGRLDADPEFERWLAYETANHVAFFLNMDQACDEAFAWAAAALEDLRRRFNVDEFPPEKLTSTWLASASCAGLEMPPEVIAQVRDSAVRRLAKAREQENVVAAEDALRGFIALSSYHYARGQIEQAKKDMLQFMKESALDTNKTDQARFLNNCTPVLGRCVLLKDITNGIAFDPNRYDKVEKVESYEWQEVGN